MHLKTAIFAGICLTGGSLAIDLDTSDPSSIHDAAKIVATSIIHRYQNNGSDIPGLFGDPYYFWECGLAWDTLIHYWHQTGDDSYNDVVGEALRWQIGDNDFAPENQTKSLGNDDQSTWALAAMSAAEYGFPSEALDGLDITWSDLAKNVFDRQAARWDNDTCNGGLRWQIFAFNNGYNYKNSMANGNFYQLAGRLARFTGNDTYATWGQRVFEWSYQVGLIGDINSTSPGMVYDGTDATNNCANINHLVWTANSGTYLAGGAYMYNHVSQISPFSYHPKQTTDTYIDANGKQHGPPDLRPKNQCYLRGPGHGLRQRNTRRASLPTKRQLQRRPARLPRRPRPRTRPNTRPNQRPADLDLHRARQHH